MDTPIMITCKGEIPPKDFLHVYVYLKVIHLVLRKMFITFLWKDQFIPAPFSYNYPFHFFLCMSHFNPLFHY